jgi:hypothetical protein
MIILPATIESISTRADCSIKIVVATQEVTPEKAGHLFQLRNKLGYVAIKEAQFSDNEIDSLTEIDKDLQDFGKTPSQRMRNVLFILYNQSNEGFTDFNSFYQAKMNKFIDSLKSKIAA